MGVGRKKTGDNRNMDRPLTAIEHVRAWVERQQNPGYSSCTRCRRPWNLITWKSVRLSDCRGCFALCVPCWDMLTVEERLVYFKRNWIKYWQGEPWEYYRAAVIYHRETVVVESWDAGKELLTTPAYLGWKLSMELCGPLRSVPQCFLIPPVAPEVITAWEESHIPHNG